MDNKNNKKEFSKGLAIFSCVLVIFIFLDFLAVNDALISGKIEIYDFTGFMYAIPAACTLCTATIIFYFNKAKLENSIKIKYEYVEKLIRLKKKLNLYSKEELEEQIDLYIQEGEESPMNELSTAEENASKEIERNDLWI